MFDFIFYNRYNMYYFFFFFQAEDGIRDIGVTGVQTCALPISRCWSSWASPNNPGSSFLRRGFESAENDPTGAKASFGELTPCGLAGTPAFCNVRQLRVHTMS